jgi:hypothetical protein
MSTLVINTIQGKTTAGSVNVRGEGSNNTNLQQGLCKQWCDWDTSGTIAIRDSFNTSSVVDHASGYSKNLYTNNFSSQDYVGSGSGTGLNYGSPAVMSNARATKLTSEILIRHFHGTNNGVVNPDDIMFTQHGDLA